MSFLTYLIISILFLIVVALICKFARINNLKLLDLISVEFMPIQDSEIKVSTKAKFGIVVSSDGKVYKTQIETLIKLKEVSAFCNATLLISGIGWFVYKQQFQTSENTRKPSHEKVILDGNTINEINVELEPKEVWGAKITEQNSDISFYSPGDTIKLADTGAKIVAVPICGKVVLDVEQAKAELIRVGAKVAIPIHYDNPKYPVDVKDFEAIMQSTNIEVKTLNWGQVYTYPTM